MHLYSISLSALVKLSSPIILEFFLACFSCSNNFILSQSSLGSDDNYLVFEKKFSSKDHALIPSDLSNLIGDLSLVLLLPKAFPSKYISLENSNINFLSNKLARSTI